MFLIFECIWYVLLLFSKKNFNLEKICIFILIYLLKEGKLNDYGYLVFVIKIFSYKKRKFKNLFNVYRFGFIYIKNYC